MEHVSRWFDAREVCIEDFNLHGLLLRKGGEVIVRVKSKHFIEFKGVFLCGNPFFGTIIIETQENNVMIKIKDIVFVQKLHRK